MLINIPLHIIKKPDSTEKSVLQITKQNLINNIYHFIMNHTINIRVTKEEVH